MNGTLEVSVLPHDRHGLDRPDVRALGEGRCGLCREAGGERVHQTL